MIKTIAIVGRPNVGKSTLFNTLINRKAAITSPNPGLTRDRTYSYFEPQGNLKYLLIDTGGLMLDTGKPIVEKVNLQVDVAIDQADLLLFVVDAKDGLMPVDRDIAQKLRKTAKPIILVVNKADTPSKDDMLVEFYSLGFERLVSVSALAKRNITGIINEIAEFLPESSEETHPEDHLTMCVVGKPNVGKSTLVNQLVGEKRVIVDSTPGTTRNPAKCYMEINGRKWELVDLAGIWRRNRGKEVEEIISMIAARREIEKADACIFMLDLSEELSFQDRRIAGWIVETATPVIIAGNKVDLIEEMEEGLEEKFHKALVQYMPFMNFAPFIMISAKDGIGIGRIYKELDKIMANSFREIPQEELDFLIEKIVGHKPPPEVANQRPKVLGLYQERVNPPVFKIRVMHHRLDKIPQHWKNYVRNSIYKEFNYYGVPLTVEFIKVGKRKKGIR
jgi:GTP-binding protein